MALDVNNTARRVCVQQEIGHRADWTAAHESRTHDEAVLLLTTQLGHLAAAHGTDDLRRLREVAIRLAGDAMAIIEALDAEAAR